MIITHDEHLKIAATIRLNGQSSIDKKFYDSANGDKIETKNSATGQVLASIAHCKPS